MFTALWLCCLIFRLSGISRLHGSVDFHGLYVVISCGFVMNFCGLFLVEKILVANLSEAVLTAPIYYPDILSLYDARSTLS